MVTIVLAFQSLLTFAFLYALIYLFERRQRSIDAYLIAVAAVVPMIAAFLVALAPGYLGFLNLSRWLWTLTLIGVTFLALKRTLELPTRRAIGYTFVILVFTIVVQIGLFGLWRSTS